MIPAARPCLRQRQLLQTRETIRRAALDLLAGGEPSSISVQDISEAAGVSPRTFFNHFRSKDEALVPDLPGFTDQQRRTFLDSTDVDLLTALERLLTDHVLSALDPSRRGGVPLAAAGLVQASPELLPRTLAVFEAFKHRLADLVAERTGTEPDGALCAVAADTALATVRGAIHRSSRDDAQDLPAALLDAFSTLRHLAQHAPSSS